MRQHDTTHLARRLGRALALVGLLGALALGGCDTSAPAMQGEGIFTNIEHRFGDETAKDDIRGDLIRDINAAKTSINIAFEHMTDVTLADALIEASQRGVRVQVVTDDGSRADVGIAKLETSKSATLEVIYGDGELVYLPEPTLTSLLEDCSKPFATQNFIQCISRDNAAGSLPNDGLMIRPNDYNVMSHNFMVVDTYTVWNLSSPFSDVGTMWFGWRAESLELAQAFDREFKQMFSGVFSTTLSAFNGPIKSTVQDAVYPSALKPHKPSSTRYIHPGFYTGQGVLGVHFNPQERLVKQVIDEIYRARGSVFLMTDELVNEFVLDALEYKQKNGFDVRVMLRAGGALNTQRAQAAGLVVRRAPARYTYLPTVLITETEKDRNGKQWPRKAMIMTHPMWNGAPFEVLDPFDAQVQTNDDVVRIYPSDMFADGSLWILRDFIGSEEARQQNPSTPDPISRVAQLWLSTWDAATPES